MVCQNMYIADCQWMALFASLWHGVEKCGYVWNYSTPDVWICVDWGVDTMRVRPACGDANGAHYV